MTYDLLQITDYCPKGVDGVIVTTAHNEFKQMKLEDLARRMNEKPVVIDVRGILNNREAEEEGFYYKR